MILRGEWGCCIGEYVMGKIVRICTLVVFFRTPRKHFSLRRSFDILIFSFCTLHSPLYRSISPFSIIIISFFSCRAIMRKACVSALSKVCRKIFRYCFSFTCPQGLIIFTYLIGRWEGFIWRIVCTRRRQQKLIWSSSIVSRRQCEETNINLFYDFLFP